MSNPFAGPHAAVGGALGSNSRLCVCGHTVGDHLGSEGRCRVEGCDCERSDTGRCLNVRPDGSCGIAEDSFCVCEARGIDPATRNAG